VTPGDPAALATLLRQVLDLPAAARAAIGDRARAHVLQAYTTAAMQAATLDLYRDLV
jgi:glycosyltransferase involved in cell wall biosynthesis